MLRNQFRNKSLLGPNFQSFLRCLWAVFAAGVVVFSAPVWSQEEAAGNADLTGQNVGWEGGFFLGNLLPNQIAGLTEITGMGGVRGGYRWGPTTFFESAFTTGNGDGAEWKNLSGSIRMDIPVENLVGLVYLGPDITYYKGVGRSNQMIFGGHVGGGIQVAIGGATWFRMDMKLGLSPGTSLFISAGIVFRMASGGGGAGGT
jgi:hypothetical protein